MALILTGRRPIKRLVEAPERGSGKAQVVDTPSQLKHIMWVASKGYLGTRNLAVMWMLFGSALRINEVAQLEVKDLIFKNGDLKKAFLMPAKYTKTNKPRVVYMLVSWQRESLEKWIKQRLNEKAMLSDDGSYGGLRKDSPFFLSKKKQWQKFAFNKKKYKEGNGKIKTTLVCSSLENLARDLLKGAGLHGGSSHSGRRSLATWLDRKDYELKLIQEILGHKELDMTLEYIDASIPRIEKAFNEIWKGVKMPEFK